jgi:lipid-A-disaccharide synthase
MLTVGIVANEPSGDLLGAALVRELKARVPDCRFVGVAGPQMQAAGCETLVPLERLSVMGLVEVLRHLRELLQIRRRLLRHFLELRPDVFIGVDAPDFNLGLERRLRSAGITTVHLVSPTVWAWRPARVKAIRRAVDLMLSIFPFEEEFLRAHGVTARYVGHPLADQIPLEVGTVEARLALGLPAAGEVIALLPGSRVSEVRALAATFLQTARWCVQRRPGLRFAVPLVNLSLRAIFEEVRAQEAPDLPVILVDGRGREVIAAADCVLTASGTATLETLLIGRPMVVAYRMSALTYHLVKGLNLVKVPYIAMANLLVGRPLAPELIQSRCRADLLGLELLAFLDDPGRVAAIRAEYRAVHRRLRRNAAARAAEAVLELIGQPVSRSPRLARDRAGDPQPGDMPVQ